MKKHCQHVHNAVNMLLGEAVIRLLAEGKHVTNMSLKEKIFPLLDGEPDFAVCAIWDRLDYWLPPSLNRRQELSLCQ